MFASNSQSSQSTPSIFISPSPFPESGARSDPMVHSGSLPATGMVYTERALQTECVCSLYQCFPPARTRLPFLAYLSGSSWYLIKHMMTTSPPSITLAPSIPSGLVAILPEPTRCFPSDNLQKLPASIGVLF